MYRQSAKGTWCEGRISDGSANLSLCFKSLEVRVRSASWRRGASGMPHQRFGGKKLRFWVFGRVIISIRNGRRTLGRPKDLGDNLAAYAPHYSVQGCLYLRPGLSLGSDGCQICALHHDIMLTDCRNTCASPSPTAFLRRTLLRQKHLASLSHPTPSTPD